MASERPGAGDSLSHQVSRWAAEEAVREAASRRARARDLDRRAAEESELADLLAAAARAGETVVVSTLAGHRHRGLLRAVGTDYVEIDTARHRALVRTAAVAVLEREPAGGGPLSKGTVPRPPADAPVARFFSNVVERLVGSGQEVRAWPLGGRGDPVTGELVGLGPDHLTLAPAGDGGATRRLSYVRLEALAELWLFMSG